MPPIFATTQHPINVEWKEYYIVLEAIRQSGIINMWGASPYLAAIAGLSRPLADQVFLSWVTNYSELAKMFWPDAAERLWVNIPDLADS